MNKMAGYTIIGSVNVLPASDYSFLYYGTYGHPKITRRLVLIV